MLRNVRLRGAVYYVVSGEGEWAAEAPPAGRIAAAVMPGSGHVMEYHVVTKGEAWAAMDGQTPIRLSAGDIVVFPHGDPHVISSAPDLRPEPADTDWFIASAAELKPIPISLVGVDHPSDGTAHDRAGTVVVCGFLGCDVRPFNPLIATLPRLLHIPASGDGGWEAALARQAARESHERGPGIEAVLERLSEMMFVDAIRRYLGQMGPDATGWLAGLRDPIVGTALALLHARPGHAWSVASLSARVGLSRSALHERFLGLVGHPPMQYLGNWRMQLAANRLTHSAEPVSSIGLDLGYGSEAAFSRAFKRIVGVTPSDWRARAT